MIQPSKNAEHLPWVTTIVAILRVTTNSNTDTLCDALVDRVNRSERISDDLVVRQRLVGARLESSSITGSRRIEHVNASENAVGVFARTSAASVRQSVRSSPVGLQEAK